MTGRSCLSVLPKGVVVVTVSISSSGDPVIKAFSQSSFRQPRTQSSGHRMRNAASVMALVSLLVVATGCSTGPSKAQVPAKPQVAALNVPVEYYKLPNG